MSGARNVNNSNLVQKMHDRMKKLFPEEKHRLTSAAVLLSNVYVSTGEIEKATDIRINLNKSGAKKKVGLSWTVIDGEVYVSLQLK